jgi:stage II sporulation protein AA (anti-sigma F factor antagonist)
MLRVTAAGQELEMPTNPPHIATTVVDGAVVVSPVGEFDIASVDLLRATFVEALATSPQIVLDLSGTRFLDSMALGTIVGAGRRTSEEGGWIRLVAPTPNVRKVLRITEIDTVVGLYDTVDEAIAHQQDAGRRDTANA